MISTRKAAPSLRGVASVCAGLLLVALAGCAGTADEAKDPSSAPAASGSAPDSAGAPDFSLPALDGTTVRLSDYRGKVVLIDFWSTTCNPCLAEMPHIVDLYKKQKDRGLVVLAISRDGPESRAQVSSTAHEREMIFPVLLDEETTVSAQYNPKGELPFSVLVGKDGSVTWKRAGYQPGSETQITTEVEKALAK
jgi:peroxiredoxin